MNYTRLLPLLLIMCCVQPEMAPEDHRLSFYNGHYSIELPAEWGETTDLNDQAIVEIRNLEEPGYMIIIPDERPLDNAVDYVKNSNRTRAHLRGALSNYAEEGPELLNINGHRALKYKISGHIDDLNIRYWHITIETEQHFLQCLFWSIETSFWKNERNFEEILHSFHSLQKK